MFWLQFGFQLVKPATFSGLPKVLNSLFEPPGGRSGTARLLSFSFTRRRKTRRQLITVALNKLNLTDVFAGAEFLSQSVLRAVGC